MENLQQRFGLRSNSAVIQVAVGLLFHLLELAREGGSICVEADGTKRPLNPLALLGGSESPGEASDGVIKYQITIDADQDQVLKNVGDFIGASTVAETVRFSLRVLDSLGRHIKPYEELIAIFANGDEAVLSLD